MNNKRIIMIHGLASKPPEADVRRLWKKCIVESIKVDRPGFFDGVNETALDDIFRMVYWANDIPSHLEDEPAYVGKLDAAVDAVIEERKDKGDGFHVGLGDKFKAFFKDIAIDAVYTLTTALTVKDDVAKGILEEVRLYSEDQYIADKVRNSLEDELRDAWDNNKEVVLVSHSMGTFIAYDVLWRFSHRNTEGYKKFRNNKVKFFITMGSPLGENVVQDILFAKRYKKEGKRSYPNNIDHWHNYACLGDVVAHDSTLKDDFFKEMHKLKILPKENARDYEKLYNPFKKPSDKKQNPHKSYGYLVQPKLSKWLVEFLND